MQLTFNKRITKNFNLTKKGNEKYCFTQPAGFEPARGDPNGFLVHRLNRSATTTCPPVNYPIKNP